MKFYLVLSLLVGPFFVCGCVATKSGVSSGAVVDSKAGGSRTNILNKISCKKLGDQTKIAFFDADSTLRISRDGHVSANAVDDVYVLPYVSQKIKDLNDRKYVVAVVSNQGGVSAGMVSYEVASGALKFMASQIEKLGGVIDYIAMAPDKDAFKKPNTGMADELFNFIRTSCRKDVNKADSFMVGDFAYTKEQRDAHGNQGDDFADTDRLFAEHVGVGFYDATDYFGWYPLGIRNISKPNDLTDFLRILDKKDRTEADLIRKINGI
jgi:DNA 3'-phosphatase